MTIGTEELVQVQPISRTPAFPVPPSRYDENAGFFMNPTEGMTYHQWLVGTIAAGIAANSGLTRMGMDLIAISAIDLADEICKRLEGTPCSQSSER